MAMNFSDIYEMFYHRIEKDDSFWCLFNVDKDTIMEIAHTRAKNYLLESLFTIVENTESDTDWTDIDEEMECFNINLTFVERHLLVSIMFEKHLERDIAMLKAFEVNFTPSDLQVFSPSNSRKTFMEMYESVKNENRVLLSKYDSRDNKNKRKTIDHSQYDYSSEFTEDES